MLIISSFGLNQLSCQSLIENLWELDFNKYYREDLITFCNVLYDEYKAIRELYLSDTGKDFIDIHNHVLKKFCPTCGQLLSESEIQDNRCYYCDYIK